MSLHMATMNSMKNSNKMYYNVLNIANANEFEFSLIHEL